MTAPAQQRDRLVELEGVRGVAAIVVLVHHSLLGFAPTLHGLVVLPVRWSLFGMPYFAFVNGSAAVVVFFVLSGFVLTYRAIETADVRLLGIAALKRWPRLAVPVVIVNVLAALLATFHLYGNAAANQLTGSTWLGLFYGGSPYPVADIFGAIYEGTVATFVFGRDYFNSNLWTMTYEFFGSFLAFGLAYLAIGAQWPRLVAIVFITALGYWFLGPFCLCFVAGVGLAFARHHVSSRVVARFRAYRALLLVAGGLLAFLLLGYHEHLGHGPMRFYHFLARAAAHNALALRVTLHTIGAVIVLVLALEFRASLATPQSAFLGRLSFPLYLLHVPVICSIGSHTYLFAFRHFGHAGAAVTAIIAVLVTTPVLAVPLAYLDTNWLAYLRQLQLFRRT